jgi:RNA polymerase sigma-70 factor (ECF subfamily)
VAIAVGGLAVALVVGVVLLSAGLPGGATASAAALTLREAADTALKQPAPPTLAEGQYLYVKSANTNLSTVEGGHGYVALVSTTREVWMGEQSILRTASVGEPQFPTEGDRQRWIDAGRPDLAGEASALSLGAVSAPDLPTDPDELFDRLKQEAAGHGNGLYEEMFTLVGDNLRESLAPSALRAALYEVAARIPGVELLGKVTDSAGREGVAVSMADEKAHIRQTLIIDMNTSVLLSEEEVALQGFEEGFPAGSVIGRMTYLITAVVDSNEARPSASK